MNKQKAIETIKIINTLIDISQSSIILNTFVNTFLTKSIKDTEGNTFLRGNFNLGGTVSGRLSSSKPNLHNIPSSGDNRHTKLIKKCFKAPEGWLFVGADFNGLEDRISALTTKDPNKLKVFIDLFDGHCLRAYTYFQNKMPNIKNTVNSINSIKTKYPELRNKSKAPTFALT